MRSITFILVLSCMLLLSACQNSNKGGSPDSEIEIRSSNGTTVISRADAKGSVVLTAGDLMQLYVYRVVRTGTVNPVYNNITNLADFNFSPPNIASMDSSGRLTGLNQGFTTLEVVYREDNNPGNDDKVSLDITVVP